MYVIPKSDRMLVIISVDFPDVTDYSLSKVFLQEFVEAQRVVRNATTPSVTFSKDPPSELSSLGLTSSEQTVGFILFQFLKTGMNDGSRKRAVSLLSQFRTYLHYHIKASKTYLHMRMRKRVNNWLQILNKPTHPRVFDNGSNGKTTPWHRRGLPAFNQHFLVKGNNFSNFWGRCNLHISILLGGVVPYIGTMWDVI